MAISPDAQITDPVAGLDRWLLDPHRVHLNHGSYGATPHTVLERQNQFRHQMERDPVGFLSRDLQPLLDDARRRLAELLGVSSANLVFVRNATAGVNAVLQSFPWSPGDEVLLTDHAYNASANATRHVASRWGVEVKLARIPFPVDSSQQVLDAVLAAVTHRTRLVLLDHVTSATALVLPVASLVDRLKARGIETLVDGAHGPGMLPLAIEKLGAAYYAGNCHKWLCAPKGTGFLYVRQDRQANMQPPIISHGYNTSRSGYSRFQDAFDWQGTDDPTSWLCLPVAIDFLEGLLEGGLTALMARNHQLAEAARKLLVDDLSAESSCPPEMLGSIATVILPERFQHLQGDDTSTTPTPTPQLGTQLWRQFGIQVPIVSCPSSGRLGLRVSAHAYNGLGDYRKLLDALARIASKGKS